MPSYNPFVLTLRSDKTPQINSGGSRLNTMLIWLRCLLQHFTPSPDEIGRPGSIRIQIFYDILRAKFKTFNDIYINCCNAHDVELSRSMNSDYIMSLCNICSDYSQFDAMCSNIKKETQLCWVPVKLCKLLIHKIKYKRVEGCIGTQCNPLTCPRLLGIFMQSILNTQCIMLYHSKKYADNYLYINYTKFYIYDRLHHDPYSIYQYKCYHYE